MAGSDKLEAGHPIQQRGPLDRDLELCTEIDFVLGCDQEAGTAHIERPANSVYTTSSPPSAISNLQFDGIALLWTAFGSSRLD